MGTNLNVQSDLPIPPGDYLSEVLEDSEMSRAELSRRMGRPAQVISEIIRGRRSITPRTAIELESALNVPAHIWLGLEGEYQLTQERKRQCSLVRV